MLNTFNTPEFLPIRMNGHSAISFLVCTNISLCLYLFGYFDLMVCLFFSFISEHILHHLKKIIVSLGIPSKFYTFRWQHIWIDLVPFSQYFCVKMGIFVHMHSLHEQNRYWNGILIEM